MPPAPGDGYRLGVSEFHIERALQTAAPAGHGRAGVIAGA
jgi:hypothetical protein